ncbi:MAG: flagellar hook-length control protein FliK [Gammaproteobacteria bacterium]
MSEISLNVAPAPELVNTAAAGSTGADRAAGAPGRPRDAAGDTAGPTQPFAALLSWAFRGVQPLSDSGITPGSSPTDAIVTADSAATTISLLALPGTATAVPPVADGSIDRATGNLLPGSGKELPVAIPTTAGAPGSTPGLPFPNAPTNTATAGDRAEAPSERPRISLADLALSRPVESSPVVSADASDTGARTAAAVALAGRNLLPPGSGPDGARRSPVNLRGVSGKGASSDLSTIPTTAATAVSPLTSALPVANLLSANGRLALTASMADVLPTAGLPGAGTDLLAGQLAAFARSSDSGSASTSTLATATTVTPDAAGGTLPGRLGTTSLPPLQPLGNTGAFAVGIADRLLTLGGPGSHSARLKLHPEHLGELDVEISMDDGVAQVWFGTNSSQARDAIEGSLPRLRELFAEQGIQLTRTQIDAGSGQAGNQGSDQQRRTAGGATSWNDAPGWQGPRGSALGRAAETASSETRLLDVWA